MIAKIFGVLFLAAGTFVLVYHGFSIPKQHSAKMGPIEVRMQDDERVEVPTWAGVASVVAGGGLLLWAGKKK